MSTEFEAHGLLPRSADDEMFVDLRWPIDQDGVYSPPPVQHLVDSQVREYFEGLDNRLMVEISYYPKAGTTAIVMELPTCDACAAVGGDNRARYDVHVDGGGMFVCTEHLPAHSSGFLGTGLGQYLFLDDEISAEASAAIAAGIEYWQTWMTENG